MRLKIDENLPEEAAHLLRDAGHEAESVLGEQLGGRPDDQVAQICRNEQRALVTLDLDFADIRAYPPEEYPGLIVLRPNRQSRRHVLRLLRSVLPVLDREKLPGCLWVVSESGLRIRESGS